jgi:hypothetical protein
VGSNFWTAKFEVGRGLPSLSMSKLREEDFWIAKFEEEGRELPSRACLSFVGLNFWIAEIEGVEGFAFFEHV